jgi:carbonic anhydrase
MEGGMQISRRALLGGSVMLTMAGLAPLPAWADEPCPPRRVYTPAEALAKLKTGNTSFEGGTLVPYDIDKHTLKCQADNKQTPFATIVCCSDSRTGPEQIFQVGLGELFIVRNAGATAANPQAVGSTEYSVAVLHVPLVVVLGHTHCGAAEGATEVVAHNKQFPGQIGGMIAPLVPAARATHIGTPEGWTDRTTHQNVINVRRELRARPLLASEIRAHKLRVEAAVYDLGTGQVSFLDG